MGDSPPLLGRAAATIVKEVKAVLQVTYVQDPVRHLARRRIYACCDAWADAARDDVVHVGGLRTLIRDGENPIRGPVQTFLTGSDGHARPIRYCPWCGAPTTVAVPGVPIVQL